jgi:raffinose/stachyose/melibiose transport system substrate-binding protein
MTDMGPWMSSQAASAYKEGVFEPVFVAMPAQDTSFPLVNQGAPGSGLFVSKAIAPEKVEAAADFLEFMFIRPESQKEWLLKASILPVTRETIDPAQFPNAVLKSVWEAHADLGAKGGVSGQWLDQFVNPDAGDVFNSGVQRLAAGAMTPEAFIEELDAATKAARAP